MSPFINKTFFVFTLAAHQLLFSGHNWMAHAPELPFISKTAKVSTHRLSQNMEDQLSAAGLSVPIMNLFPKESEEAQLIYDSSNPQASKITGQSSVGMEKWGNDLKIHSLRPAFDNLPGANPVVFSKTNMAESIMTAVHEITHYIDYRQRLTEEVIEHAFDRNPIVAEGTGQTVVDCLRERIADASSALYLLSNCEDRDEAIKAIHSRTMLRSFYLEVSHYTADILKDAVAAFDRNPKRGLTVDQTARWAARIVEKKPDVLRQLDEVIGAQEYLVLGSARSPLTPMSREIIREAIMAYKWYYDEGEKLAGKPESREANLAFAREIDKFSPKSARGKEHIRREKFKKVMMFSGA